MQDLTTNDKLVQVGQYLLSNWYQSMPFYLAVVIGSSTVATMGYRWWSRRELDDKLVQFILAANISLCLLRVAYTSKYDLVSAKASQLFTGQSMYLYHDKVNYCWNLIQS